MTSSSRASRALASAGNRAASPTTIRSAWSSASGSRRTCPRSPSRASGREYRLRRSGSARCSTAAGPARPGRRSTAGAERDRSSSTCTTRSWRSRVHPDLVNTPGIVLLGPTLMAHGDRGAQGAACRASCPARRGGHRGSRSRRPDRISRRWNPRRTGGQREWVDRRAEGWTTFAPFAQFGFVLCRTDPESRRHTGLTLLICPDPPAGRHIQPSSRWSGDPSSPRSSSTVRERRWSSPSGRRATDGASHDDVPVRAS